MNLQKHVSLNINVRGLGESPTLAPGTWNLPSHPSNLKQAR